MRTTIVPAQITTVEDRIMGNIGVSQLMLFIAPLFVGGAFYMLLPPFFNYAVYKIVIAVCIAFVCAILAIRFKGKIVLFWLIALLLYNLRPQYYVLDKNDTHLRENEKSTITQEASETEVAVKQRSTTPHLSTAELIQAEDILNDPAITPSYEINKRGELRVRLTEITR